MGNQMIQHSAQSPEQQERFKRRAFIGVRVEALLDPYWDRRPSDVVKDEILQDWMDALESFQPDEIRSACRSYLSGKDRAKKPKPGDIKAICISNRAFVAKRNPPPVAYLPQPTRAEMDAEMEKRKAFAATILRDIWRAK